MTSRTLVRPARPGDERGLVDLFGRVYGRPMTAEHWLWKLGRWSAPVPNVWLAERDGAPVCQYAAMPAAARLHDREATAMVAVDAMTSPEHRRQGLLTDVVARAHEAWRENGIPLVLGLPNEQWGGRSQALGWRPLFRLRWLALPLRPAAVLRRRYGAVVATALGPVVSAWFRGRRRAPVAGREPEARDVSRAGPCFDALWEKLGGSVASSIRRDGPWAGWRFLAAPEPGYRVLLVEGEGKALGWSAFRVDRSRGHAAGLVADLVADPSLPGAFEAVLERTLAALAADGAEAASTLAVEGTARYTRLRRSRFLPRRHGFTVHAVILDPRLDVEALARPAGWDMAGGDFDVI